MGRHLGDGIEVFSHRELEYSVGVGQMVKDSGLGTAAASILLFGNWSCFALIP
ncbi:MAG: hypothetical protein PUK66_01490 [Bacteroidales bacterium]|uniref:hypothetical protein n=1 Tax=Porphyromonas sp. TaxID=1924944 RepID=UPI002976D95B|nr:hypothetical protein [Porphyromonas sp.]MDD7437504.1 hypothetical protein [Bacteroidales bacterium]MDY3066388.1 hypothetical protein [Porphyromonas sp.]